LLPVVARHQPDQGIGIKGAHVFSSYSAARLCRSLCALSPAWTEQHLDTEHFGRDTLRPGRNQHFADQNVSTLLEGIPAIY
jgi:hypothetical protein